MLAGEITYSVWREQAEEPAVRMRQAIARLSRNATTSEGDLLALRIASVDFASLLVQLAANAAASGQASGAPEEPSAELAAKVSSVIAELASRAQEVERPVSDRADVVAHHLAAGLRVRVPQETLQRSGAISTGRVADWTLLDRLRDPWLRLATNEYMAVDGTRRSARHTDVQRTLRTPRQRDRRRRHERDLRRPPGWPAGGVSTPPGVAPPSGRVDLRARGVRHRTPRPRPQPRPRPADHAHPTRARHGRDRADRPRSRSCRR